jgi:hypothetical protein
MLQWEWERLKWSIAWRTMVGALIFILAIWVIGLFVHLYFPFALN